MDTSTLKNRRTRRPTLTLESDVPDYVEHKLAANRKLREKNVINDLLRKGLRMDESGARPDFKIKPFETKLASGISAARLEDLLDEM